MHVALEPKAVALERARRPRVEREDDRLLERVQGLDDPAEGGLRVFASRWTVASA